MIEEESLVKRQIWQLDLRDGRWSHGSEWGHQEKSMQNKKWWNWGQKPDGYRHLGKREEWGSTEDAERPIRKIGGDAVDTSTETYKPTA